MLYHHLMKGTEVPDGDTQWVRVEHLDAGHGPSESPPKPNLGAMEHSSCLQEQLISKNFVELG